MKRLAVVFVVVASSLSACSNMSSYAAKVNGVRISERELRGELNKAVAAEHKARPGAIPKTLNAVPSAFVAEVLQRLVHINLVESQVKRDGIAITPTDRAKAHTAAQSANIRWIAEEPLLEREYSAAIALQRVKGNVKCFVVNEIG